VPPAAPDEVPVDGLEEVGWVEVVEEVGCVLEVEPL
jgi:hypothetical protein